jgi:hypothetical protein
MRRLILLVISGIIATSFSCKSSQTPSRQNTNRSQTSGKIQPRTKQQITSEQRKARKAELKRQRELKRQQRLANLARRRAGYGYYGRGYTRGRRGGYTGAARTRRKTTVGVYTLTGIYTVNNEKYAIIDGQTKVKGDDVSGRKILEVLSDRIILDDNGQRREVKIGESVLPNLITPSPKR